jgi:hypothetical protein
MRNSILGLVAFSSLLGVVWAIFRIALELNMLIQAVAGPLAFNTAFPIGNFLKFVVAIVWSPAISTRANGTDDAPHKQSNRPHLRVSVSARSSDSWAVKPSIDTAARASIDAARRRVASNYTPTIADREVPSRLVGLVSPSQIASDAVRPEIVKHDYNPMPSETERLKMVNVVNVQK